MNGRKGKGFTLVELMIVVAILAVIASFAIPSYMNYALRSHRVEARNMLETIAQRVQQNYNVTRDWGKLGDGSALTDATLASWGLNQSPANASGNGVKYVISFVGTPDDSGFLLEARAVNGQMQDRQCSAFYLDSRGIKMAINNTGSAPSRATVNSRDDISRVCWTR